MRALPANLFEYFGETALGKTALPGAVGAAGDAAGRSAGIVEAGAAAASAPALSFAKIIPILSFKGASSLRRLVLSAALLDGQGSCRLREAGGKGGDRHGDRTAQHGSILRVLGRTNL
jgi:hypothetical protein